MSSPQFIAMSRAISELDLNAKLVTVQEEQNQRLRYTEHELLGFRSTSEQSGGHIDASEPGAEGVRTPPHRTCPDPPPPTPASPGGGPAPIHNLEAAKKKADRVLASMGIAQTEPTEKKKKKKKSSGKNKKAAPTGFEGMSKVP